MLVCETYCVGRYYETTSWIDTARSTANCSSQGAKVRITEVSANNTKQNKTLLPPTYSLWNEKTGRVIGYQDRLGTSIRKLENRIIHFHILQEELWTTALLAHAYGAAGLSAFNFVYTRPFFDVPCQFELNKPYSEPLW